MREHSRLRGCEGYEIREIPVTPSGAQRKRVRSEKAERWNEGAFALARMRGI